MLYDSGLWGVKVRNVIWDPPLEAKLTQPDLLKNKN
jgi:hypothetical protein